MQQRVANRYLVRLAARQALAGGPRIASQGLTPEVLAAFAEGFYQPVFEGKVAFGNLLGKLKVLVQTFNKVPKLWAQFKALLGIQSLSDVPGAIRELGKRGHDALKSALVYAFKTLPLKIYTLSSGKLKGVADFINDLIHKSPAFQQFMSKAKLKVDSFDGWLREKLPVVSRVLLVAVYIWVWFNVVEFEWDLKGLSDAVSGQITLSDLLASLPSSGLGFLMNVFNLGTFTLLPYTIVARVMYLLLHRYLTFDGHGFKVNRPLLAKDFGMEPDLIPVGI